MMKTPIEASADIALFSVDPARNRARYYRMIECRSLFGEHALVIVRGRIGHRLRLHTEFFDHAIALAEHRDVLLAVRQRHGYTLKEVA